MVAVQVRQRDDIDRVRINPEPLQRHERSGPEIQRKPGATAVDQEAGVVAPARAERVPASDDRQAHGQPLALGRAASVSCQRRTLASSGGTESLAGFMKSIPTRHVMSATEN